MEVADWLTPDVELVWNILVVEPLTFCTVYTVCVAGDIRVVAWPLEGWSMTPRPTFIRPQGISIGA